MTTEVHWCGNSWVCCDGECWNCFATDSTYADKTDVNSITYSNVTDEVKGEQVMSHKKLIDVNYVIGAFKRYSSKHPDAVWDADGIEKVLNSVQPADAIEVVRCKNCEHSRRWGEEGTLLCYRDKTTIHIVKPDAYCDGSQRRYATDCEKESW